MSDTQPASSDAIKKRVDVQAALAAAQSQTSISAPLGDWTLRVDLKLEPTAAMATPADGTETPRPPRPKQATGAVAAAPLDIRAISLSIGFSAPGGTLVTPADGTETPRPPRPKDGTETPRPPRKK